MSCFLLLLGWMDSSIGSGSRGFALQPPPTDLPLSKSLGVPGSLSELEIKRMNETEAKRMVRQQLTMTL